MVQMPQMIVTAGGPEDAREAVEGGAEIVELRDPAGLAAVRSAVADRAVLALCLPAETVLAEGWTTPEGLPRLAILFPRGVGEADLRRVSSAVAGPARACGAVAVVPADGALDGLALEALREAGFRRVRIDLAGDAIGGDLIRHASIPALVAVAEACHREGLGIEFGGGLEAPDVARLLPAAPEALRFDHCLRSEGRIDRRLVAAMGTLLSAREADDRSAGSVDCIFVRDHVVDLAIGAYSHELGRRQKVRFSVEAQVRRRTREVGGMGDVYSYDLITDAVEALAAGAHVGFVEVLAEDLAARVLADPRVVSVMVRVEKLELRPGSVGIEIRRP